MIYAFEHLKEPESEYLTELEKEILLHSEPFIDFTYSLKEKMYSFQRHHFIEDGKDIYKLRLHKLENLRQGFICTDFYEAEMLSILLETGDDYSNLQKDYPWIAEYLVEQKNNSFIELIAIPISCYIAHYAKNLKQLKLLDIDAICAFEKK